MRILQGVLALGLLASPCAADERLQPYFGTWAGTVTTSANDCEWRVRVRFSPSGESLRGSFTYSGPCAKRPGSGYFNADASAGDCLKGSFSLPGLPSFNGEACFDEDGSLVFKTQVSEGRLTLSADGENAGMEARSPLGSAEGSFIKQHPPRSSKSAKKGKKNEKKGKPSPPAPEVLIGRY